MGENEKLGFTFEVAPYDFSTFNRFFGATTPWVDGECSTQVWNGSQRPNSEDYLKVREFVVPKGSEVIPKKEFEKELGGKPHKVVFDIPNCKLSYKDDMFVVEELTSFPTTIPDSPQLQKAVERLQEELSKPFPMLFKKPTKRNKHYKPKFTL